MRDDEIAVVAVVTMLIGGVVAMWSVYHTKRHASSKARLAVIEKALDHPVIDDGTKGEMLRLLAEEHRLAQRPFLHQFGGIANIVRVLSMAAGWILFLVAAGVYALYAAGVWRDQYSLHEFGIAGIFGFVLMTLPAAVRELSRRGGAAPVKQ